MICNILIISVLLIYKFEMGHCQKRYCKGSGHYLYVALQLYEHFKINHLEA